MKVTDKFLFLVDYSAFSSFLLCFADFFFFCFCFFNMEHFSVSFQFLYMCCLDK
jgi:hypothetical protein